MPASSLYSSTLCCTRTTDRDEGREGREGRVRVRRYGACVGTLASVAAVLLAVVVVQYSIDLPGRGEVGGG